MKGYYSLFFFFFIPFSSFAQSSTDQGTKTDSLIQLDLQEVIITARKSDRNITNPTMGVESMKIEKIRLLPAIMGETDILKAIQLLPGVQAISESSTGFSVRGGSPDQNLIVLDNTTIYNPVHQMGFFSAFNNDVISEIELYKGNFPFRHGGRLSSLLEVKTRDESPSAINATGGIGLISSRLMIEGPLGEKTTWMVAGRRTYADLFLVFAKDKDLRDATLYFYDLNGKFTHRFSEKDKLELNFYNGSDNMGMPNDLGDFIYGNTASSITWNHVLSPTLFGKFSAHFTNYHYNLASDINQSNISWKSAITDWAVRADFHQPISKLWDLSYGVSGIYHSFKPGEVRMTGLNLTDYVIPENEAFEYGVYLSGKSNITDYLTAQYGLRFSAFQNTGKATYTGWEPGLGLVYRLTESSSVKANYSHNVQYMQLANNSASGSPLDVWFPAGPQIKPQQVNLYSAGYFRNFSENQYEASVEVYYKDLRNVIDFKEHSNLLMNSNLENEVRTGRGKAYGIEWMIRKNAGRLTGFVNYTLSRSERTIPEINQGKTYLAPYDKTHVINATATYHLSEKMNISAIWTFATGLPTTYPTGRFAVFDEYFPIYSGRNEYRKPNYDRLDLSLNYIPNPDSKKRWKSEWNFSVYNAYNRKNPWTIMYRQNDDTGIPYAEMMYLFGIVPSITYNFKF